MASEKKSPGNGNGATLVSVAALSAVSVEAANRHWRNGGKKASREIHLHV